ncbi:MAG: FtsQ-type POTRA domain-containing protein [Clostridia bacterium]|nr:FtsQ-type POTRA domain-containing protein [Clostridia bacterium]
MKAKRLFVISLAAICALAILLSVFFIFTVKDVKTTYAVGESTDVSKIEKVLDGYVDKNLLFIDTEDIRNDLEKFPYFEILSIEKDFPNVINVKLKERREIYYINYAEKVYLLDQNGFVLNALTVSEFNSLGKAQSLISLSLKGVNVTSMSVGSTLVTDDESFVKTVFEMAVSVNLTDCVNTIIIDKTIESNGEVLISEDNKDAYFITNTGVEIAVRKVNERGEEKVVKAFESYDNALDYYKTFDTIEVYLTDVGEIKVNWTVKDREGQNA